MGTLANPLSSMAGGFIPQPIGGTSLDTTIQSLQNLTGEQGQSILSAGTGGIAPAQGVTGQGLVNVGGGLQQANSGITAAAPALQFLTALTQGNQADITQATQPQIDQITQQFDQIRNLVSMQPRGGGKTSTLAEAPFQQAASIQRTQEQARTSAAGELGNLSTQMAQLGLGEANVGLGVAGIGQTSQSLALQEAALGAGLEDTSANTALTKQGLNYGQPSALSQLESAVNTFI